MTNRMIILALAAAICAASCAGCAKTQSPDDRVLLTVSNKSITLKEFKAKIAKMPAYYRTVVEKDKKRYVDELILETLLYEEAVRKGLDKDREVREVIDEAKKKIITAKFITNEVDEKVKVDEREAMLFYESNRDKFKTPELWRASHILVANEKEAEDILTELAAGASFEELARLHSMDATASRGGDVGYFRVGQVVPDFEKVCLKLNVGSLSGIVHTQFGYHIIKLTDRKEPAIESYEKVRKAIEAELKKKKRGELFDRLVSDLKDRYNVRIQEDVLRALEDEGKDKDPQGGMTK